MQSDLQSRLTSAQYTRVYFIHNINICENFCEDFCEDFCEFLCRFLCLTPHTSATHTSATSTAGGSTVRGGFS